MKLCLHYRDDLGKLDFEVEVEVDDDGYWVLRRPGEALLRGRERVTLAPHDLPLGAPRGEASLVVEVG